MSSLTPLQRAARVRVARCAASLAASLAGALLAGTAWTRTALAQEPDSAALHRAARAAQARFERVRRWRAPLTLGGAPGACEQRIGRFCWWYDPRFTLPAEPDDIRQARDALLATLAPAAARLPGDGWITGQRVRYLVERGDTAAAAVAAAACAAEPWWCAALRGFAAQAAGHTLAAERAFDSALALMPRAVRCSWTDLAVLLPPDARRSYRAHACGPGRDRANTRLWWLARPLLARAGDDRRAEHHARLTMTALLRDAETPYALAWGDDLGEMIVRYGWSRGWTRGERTASGEQLMTGHEPAPSVPYLPVAGAVDGPIGEGPLAYALEAGRARARYARADVRLAGDLDAQLGVFRRGGELLVVAPWRGGVVAARAAELARRLVRPGDGSGPDVRWAALAAAPAPDAPIAVDSVALSAAHPAASAGGALTVRAPLAPGLVSLEFLTARQVTGRDTVGPALVRHREWLHPPGLSAVEFAVSAPLLVASPDEPPATPAQTLDAVLPRALPLAVLHAPGRVHVYWELYGLPAGRTPIRVALAMRGERRSWLRRLGERVTGNSPVPPPLLRWSDVAVVPPRPLAGGADAARPVVGRELALDLPRLPAGRYDLELTVTLADGRTARAVRRLRLR